jgi:hypothetical protein
MLTFPHFEHSVYDVRRAGKALTGDLVWSPESRDSIIEIFKIANGWRDSHAVPMRRLRYELAGQLRRCKAPGQTVARLKRMPSIRRKLRAGTARLHQIKTWPAAARSCPQSRKSRP